MVELKLPDNWNIKESKLVLNLEFNNFTESVLFVNSLALLAENENHHPDINIYSYKKLEITLFTHSEKKVTEKDIHLAESINRLLETYEGR